MELRAGQAKLGRGSLQILKKVTFTKSGKRDEEGDRRKRVRVCNSARTYMGADVGAIARRTPPYDGPPSKEKGRAHTKRERKIPNPTHVEPCL